VKINFLPVQMALLQVYTALKCEWYYDRQFD